MFYPYKMEKTLSNFLVFCFQYKNMANITFHLFIFLALASFTFQQCTSLPKTKCGAGTCANFYWNGVQCLTCSNDVNANLSSTTQTKNIATCICNFPYVWDSTYFFCRINCSIVTSSGYCGKTYCNNYFWNGSSCVSCQTVPNAQSYAITASQNNVCLCINGYVWDGFTFTCKSCTSYVTTAADCGSGQCQNFIWINEQCIDCSSIPNTIGFVNTYTNNQCGCSQGYFWSMTSCKSCNQAEFAQCGALTCNSYFWDGETCNSCDSINGTINYAYTYANNTICQCNTDRTWSSLTYTCFNCQLALTQVNCGTDCLNYYWDGSNCINCNTILKTIAQTSITDGSRCLCQQGYKWISNRCVINVCPAGTQVNTTTYTCVCSSINDIFVDQSCITCQQNSNQTGKRSDPGSCQCSLTFTFDPSLKKCVCNSSSILINQNCFQCVKNQNQTGENIDQTSCACTSINMVFDPTLLKCKCNQNSIWINNGCIPCQKNSNQTGLSTDQNTCECTSIDYQYSSTFKKCICVNNAIWVNNACFACQSNSNQTGLVVNQVCGCKNANFVFDLTAMKCVCNQKSVWSKDTCTPCLKNANQTGLSVNDLCQCVSSNFIFNTILSKCVCKSNSIWLKNTCFSCLANSNQTGRIIGSGCQCVSPAFVFNPNLQRCVCSAASIWLGETCFACVKNSNQTGTVVNQTSCGCASSSFIFDSTLQMCVCNSISVWINNTCVPCSNNTSIKSNWQRVNDTTCSCPTNSTWSINKCVCDQYSANINSKCFDCRNSAFSTGTVNGSGCGCYNFLIWSSVSLNCTCNKNNAFIAVGNTFTCYPCTAANNAVGSSTFTSCTCKTNFAWNAQTSTCQCAAANVNVAGLCINCAKITNGIAKASNTACSCKDKSIWSSATNTCVTCASLGGVNKLTQSSCSCKAPKTWSSIIFKCT